MTLNTLNPITLQLHDITDKRSTRPFISIHSTKDRHNRQIIINIAVLAARQALNSMKGAANTVAMVHTVTAVFNILPQGFKDN